MINFGSGWESSSTCPRVAKWIGLSIGRSDWWLGLSLNYHSGRLWPELNVGPTLIIMPGYARGMIGDCWIEHGRFIKAYTWDKKIIDRWRAEAYGEGPRNEDIPMRTSP